MPVLHYIAMDTHSYNTEICVKTRANKPGRHFKVPTTISDIRDVIESIKRPRYLCFEEGPLAGWLYRNLKEDVDGILVSDPRKNAWISKAGDKDDPIDANKLGDLFAGGYLRSVHQSQDADREVFKQLVCRYHERVRRRVSEGNKIVGWLRRWGVMVIAKDFDNQSSRKELLERLPAEAQLEPVRAGLKLMLESYDQLCKQEDRLGRLLEQRAKKEEFLVRLEALPGISWIRASTFFVFIDTPFRFENKSSLWKYLGIGLTRSTSGSGPQKLKVERKINTRLKSMIIGAAKTVIERNEADNPFAAQYRQWKEDGLSPRNARRNVARSLACVAWGMWKSGSVYEPARVGKSSSE